MPPAVRSKKGVGGGVVLREWKGGASGVGVGWRAQPQGTRQTLRRCRLGCAAASKVQAGVSCCGSGRGVHQGWAWGGALSHEGRARPCARAHPAYMPPVVHGRERKGSTAVVPHRQGGVHHEGASSGAPCASGAACAREHVGCRGRAAEGCWADELLGHTSGLGAWGAQLGGLSLRATQHVIKGAPNLPCSSSFLRAPSRALLPAHAAALTPLPEPYAPVYWSMPLDAWMAQLMGPRA